MSKLSLFLSRCFMAIVVLLCPISSAFAAEASVPDQMPTIFKDVPEDAWYADSVNSLNGLGLLNGVGDGYFLPEKNITLAEIITIATRLNKMYAGEEISGMIEEEPATTWYAPYVQYCLEKGILNDAGITNTDDSVLNHPASRATVAALMRHAIAEEHFQEINQINQGQLQDVPVNAEWTDEVYSLYRSGILTGMDEYGLFAPAKDITRAETAAVLSRIIDPSQRKNLNLLSEEEFTESVYLGLRDYGNLTNDNIDSFVYQFAEDGQTVQYTIPSDDQEYTVQNQLQEGKIYHLFQEGNRIQKAYSATPSVSGSIENVDDETFTINGTVFSLENVKIFQIQNQAGGSSVVSTSLAVGSYVNLYMRDGWIQNIYIVQPASTYVPPIHGTPGVRTIKNLLMTATEPIGTTLYIYGGNWNWQDTGGSVFSNHIGLAQSWKDFYAANTADYTYKNPDASHSYYPFGNFNQYYYAGIDCSGYIGWSIYNCIHTQNGEESYVIKSSAFSKNLADHFGYGTWEHSFQKKDLLPGDVISMNGHVWMCLGRCHDGSIVIVHSTPADSYTGGKGGGPELSALGDEKSEAYALASEYTKLFYPSWASRYPVKAIEYSSYAGGTASTTGRFTWAMGSALNDPEGYRSMSADEILKDMYGR